MIFPLSPMKTRVGNDGQAPLLDLPREPLDLPAMEQELAVPQGIMVEDVGRLVRADVALDEKNLAAPDLGVALLEADAAGPDRFHLAPDEGHSGLEGFEDDVVVGDGLVDRDVLHGSTGPAAGDGTTSMRAIRRLLILETVRRKPPNSSESPSRGRRPYWQRKNPARVV